MSKVIRIDTSGREVWLPIPSPEHLAGGALLIRDAAESDIPFIDALQKANNTAVGFMPNAQLAGHIEKNHVPVAEDAQGRAVGYGIGVDKYFKREDIGVIYQMNITPARRRGLVAASLLQAMFDRSAYGVKLYCCWCAQDLAANRFWEAMRFVPLAFRTGSRKKSWKGADGARHKGPRIHIFWQKRIRHGDDQTPWWFPSQTGVGRCVRTGSFCRSRWGRIGVMRSRRCCRGWKTCWARSPQSESGR